MAALQIFAEYFYIGLFSVGGGLATIPFLYALAERVPWLTAELVGNIQAVAQSAPGAVGVNMAAQAGYYGAGVPGAAAAVLGLITPSVIIIALIARAYQAFRTNKTVNAVFTGMRPAATGLLAAAGFAAIRTSLWTTTLQWKQAIILAAFIFAVMFWKKHPIVYIAAGAVIGIALKL
jgi:chromate transporter